jgi:thymidylate kinase
MKQHVIFFEWPSNAGKSTAVKTLLEKHGRFFHLNMDKIKWLISDYSNKNKWDKIMLRNMIHSMAKIALDEWFSLIIESQKQLVDVIKKSSNNIDVKCINIEAPLDTLKSRFRLRVEWARKEGRKLGNTSEDRLVDIYNDYNKNKFTEWITLDTSKLSKEEVVREIETYIWTV